LKHTWWLLVSIFYILPVKLEPLDFPQEISGMPQLEMLDLPSLGHGSPWPWRIEGYSCRLVNFAQKPLKKA
jgi:hypothetical protein